MQQLVSRPSQAGNHLPCGLWSLWDMMEIHAAKFVDTIRVFRTLEVGVSEHAKTAEGLKSVSEVIDDEDRPHTAERLAELNGSCAALGATVTCMFIADCEQALDSKKLNWSGLAEQVEQIHRVLLKEITQTKLLAITPLEAGYYDNAIGKFDVEVVFSFSAAIAEIDEAGKCFALGRHTACVFHLMRALEVPLSALGKILLPDDPRPNWDPILAKIDAELDLPHKDRKIKGDVDFYAGISSHMHAVKIAWRNRVMHVDAIFTEDRAKVIFDATIGLMNHLAYRISEEGEILENAETPS